MSAGRAALPDPVGTSSPVHALPRRSSRREPGVRRTALACAKVEKGCARVPSPARCAEQST